MAEGFKIADAYVDVAANVSRQELERSATVAGDRAGVVIGDRATKGTAARLRNGAGQFVAAGAGVGAKTGMGIVSGIGGGLSTLASTLGTNPYVLAAGAAVVGVVAPMIGAGIAGAITLGAGAGIIGLGAMLLKDEPAFIAAATDLKTKATNIFKSAAKPMLQPFINSIGIFSKLLEEQAPNINKMFSAMAPAIEPMATALAGLATNAMPGFLKMVETAGPMMKDLAPSIEKFGAGLGIMFDFIAKSGPHATTFFKDFIQWLTGAVMITGAVIYGLSVAYTEIRNFFTSIPGWVSSAVSWFGDMGSKIASFFTETIPGWFSSGGSAVSTFFTDLWTTVTTKVNSIADWFGALPGRIGAFLSALPGQVGAFFYDMWLKALYWMSFGIVSTLAFFASLPGKAHAFIMSMVANVVTGFETAKFWAITKVAELVNGTIAWFQALPGRASQAVSSLWGTISGAFVNAKNSATAWMNNLVVGAVDILRSLPGKAASAVSGLASSIASHLRGAVDSAHGIGRDIISGMINGIKSMIGAAVKAAKDAVGSIVSGAKNALGIKSPSKVAEKEVGRWFLPGVTRGVVRSIPKARGIIQDAVRGVTSVDPSVAGIAGRGANDPASSGGAPAFHFGPGSITLDASKIKSIGDLVDMIQNLTPVARSYRTGTVGATA